MKEIQRETSLIIYHDLLHKYGYNAHPPPLRPDDLQAAVAVAVEQKRLRVPPEVPQGVKSLIESCWHADPTMRPSFDEVMVTLDELNGVEASSQALTVHEVRPFRV